MTLYAVRCQSAAREVRVHLVDADSARAAARRGPFAERDVLTARRHWSEWLGLRRADPNEQRLLLAQMSMQLARGGLAPEELERLVAGLPTLRRNRSRRRTPTLAGLAPHELLAHLNLHPFAVALCREGERLGRVPELLLQAAEFLDLHQRTQRELQGPLTRAALYALTAVGLFAATPFLFQLALDRLSERIVLPTTAATDVLLGIHAALTDYLPLTLAAAAALAALGVRGWPRLRRLPLLRDCDGFARARRSHLLVSILAPAFRRGIHLSELMRSLSALLGPAASDYLYERLRAGHSLSQSLPERHFSRTLGIGLHRFEDCPAEQLPQLFATVQTNLRTEVGWLAGRIARWTRWFYSGLIVLLLLLLVKGFLVPIYSLSVQ